MIKKIAVLLVIILMFSNTAFAEKNITVTIDNMLIEFDVQPMLINDRTMVPLRKIFEKLGAEVEWYDESQLVLATKNEVVIAMEIDKPSISVTNVLEGKTDVIELDVAPMLVDSRTLVPVRAISECLGYSVDWIDETNTVVINTDSVLRRD